MKDIVLSIGLLVSNRRDTITRCLESLRTIRDELSCELIILDTGCDADVRGVLNKYGDIIEDFVWCNDFSAARNVCLSHASGEWFLYLDDDEWFIEVNELIDFFSSGEYRKFASASYIQRNYLDMQGSQYTDTRVGRMAKITPELQFRSKIHEYLAPIFGRNKNLCATVEHYGYVYETEEAKRAHFERNSTLLEQMIDEEPLELRWRLQLLQEYRTMDDYAVMEELGRAGIEMIANSNEDIWTETEVQIYIGSFYAAEILACMGKGEYLRADGLCLTAQADTRNTRLCHAFLKEMLAKANFYIGLQGGTSEVPSEEWFLRSQQYALEYLEALTYYENSKEELYQLQIAPFVGECFDLVKVKEIYSILICDGLKLKSASNLKKYVEKLHWNEPHVYVFEEIADTLIEAMNAFDFEMKEEDECYRAFSKTIRIMHGQHALWEYFCREIQSRKQQGRDTCQIMQLIAGVVPEAVSVSRETVEARSELSPEMQQLAAQIKEQLRLLMDNGMKEQARAILAQVKEMLPGDAELEEMERQF